MSGFVHLHCHTTCSLLDGAIPADHLPHLAAERGYDAVAMTDHDSLLGAVRFARACEAAGVKPIFGAELTVASNGGEDGADAGGRLRTVWSPEARRHPQPPTHVTVIARNQTGYGNLCRLISEAHLSNERGSPATTFAAIADRAEGLFVLSGCARGEVPRLAAAGRMPAAVAAARKWHDAIGDGYRIEVFDHRGSGDRTLRDRLLAVARETGIRAVATNDVHYVDPVDAITHELLHSIHDIVPLSRTQALRPNSEYGFKSPAEMRALFADHPEVTEETLRIAEACDFVCDLGPYHFPFVPMPPGQTPTGLLARRCFEGARRRYGSVSRTVEERLQHELRIIFDAGFAAYFLLVADIVAHVREVLGIRCACRGSAAGSLVCYALGISDVDPVRYDLLFERFMNSRRDELPDIDIDVESHRREEVLTYILDTYGAEQTAVCCMVDTFRARMAIREIGKALGLPAEEVDLVAKAFPRVAARDIPNAIARLPELAGTNLRSGQLERLFELCLAIDGFPRHLALHPSGVVLSSPDLGDRVPMQESFGGFTMLQADKDDVEELGLVKLDVLGVRMLSSISHAVSEIERERGTKVDLGSLPHDDKKTFELIRSSRTIGCFQIESPGQRELLARFQPNRFRDLIVDISLFRPGPVKSDMVSPYLERRHGFEEVVYPHERLKAILAETQGVVVFHEQVIRVIAEATGCSLADADYVRRHLDADSDLRQPQAQRRRVEDSNSRPAAPDDPDDRPGRGSSHPRLGEDWVKDERVTFGGVHGPIRIAPPASDVGSWFVSSAVANGFTLDQARRLWKEVFAFASFGFCKSHAAAFALPTYLSAWLKAHYPAEFLAGVLTHEPGMYPRRLIVADARQMGIPILPIDVNRSDATYRVELVPATTAPMLEGDSERFGALSAKISAPRQQRRRALCSPRHGAARSRYGIRLALSAVRDVSDAEIASIVAARQQSPFVSLEDLWRRTDLSQPVLEHLVHVGALDSISGRRSRRELLWRALDLAKRRKPVTGTQLQFPLDEPLAPSSLPLPAYSVRDRTEAELEVTGIDAHRHVMDLYRPLLADLGCIPADRLGRQPNRSEAWIAGVKVASQTPAIRSGQRIIFVTLDDLTGPIDVTVFERAQPRCARTVFHSWLLLVRGEVRKRGGASLTRVTDPDAVGITIVADEVFDLAELAHDRAAGHDLAAALDRQRRRQSLAGLEHMDGPKSKLWHASGGSAGR